MIRYFLRLSLRGSLRKKRILMAPVKGRIKIPVFGEEESKNLWGKGQMGENFLI